MRPAARRFGQRYQGIADAISRLDVDQVDREKIADAITDAFTATDDMRRFHASFNPETFRLIARDPLVACAGYHLHATGEHVACPAGREIRVAMHLSDAPDGRSQAWRPTKPEIRCVSCGSMEFNPEYQRNVLEREAVA